MTAQHEINAINQQEMEAEHQHNLERILTRLYLLSEQGLVDKIDLEDVAIEFGMTDLLNKLNRRIT